MSFMGEKYRPRRDARIYHVEHEDDRDHRYGDGGGENALLTDYRALYGALGGIRFRFPFVVDM